MKMLVVGKNGTIAKHWIERMIQRGHEAHATGRRESVKFLSKDLDVLVTLPGSVWNNKLGCFEERAWGKVIEDNLTAVFDALDFYIPYMSKGGAIVVVGSIVGSTGGYGCANYAAAKAGLVGLVRAAANENPDLRINLLELGYVDAGMGARLSPDIKEKVLKTIPMKRFATLDEVVHAIDFLATQTYMTGNVLTFAGGLR